jgi:hypothetical protein
LRSKIDTETFFLIFSFSFPLHCIIGLPSPLRMRGEFSMTGTPLSLLTAPLHLSSVVSQTSGLTALQLELFLGLQKSMDRTG